MNLENGSSSENFPYSHNIIADTIVIAFVCDERIPFYRAAFSYQDPLYPYDIRKQFCLCALSRRQNRLSFLFTQSFVPESRREDGAENHLLGRQQLNF
jgi:hypothetical protein